ncbi:hypothetical protein QFC21_006437 [Naganishia friedmannii]|uniref:Uncharacterized protein n=1 Tax=Naganishia friedmannii TaxID=89922 RepID=A0ACC2V464_9TREE|nr:hypothetical protein QFC21_006437 [Naganishia friedmannii]
MSTACPINMPSQIIQATSHPSHEDVEIETWCTVCDRLILLPPAVDLLSDELESVSGRVNVKAKKTKTAIVHPPLKRSQAAALAKLAKLPVPPSRPKPVEPTRPHLLQRRSCSAAAKPFNAQLYCSPECAEVDQKQSSVQVQDMENYMAACGCPGDLNEVLVSPVNLDELAITSEPKLPSAEGDHINFGYFEMAINGVENSLLERDRRRSLHSRTTSSGQVPTVSSCWTTGAGMKRKNSRGYPMLSPFEHVTAPNLTVASTESLSSMWSSCDGRTFSEGSATGGANTKLASSLGIGYGGYDLGLPAMSDALSSGSSGERRRGSQTSPWSNYMVHFTPLVQPTAGKTHISSPLSSRRPSGNSTRSASSLEIDGYPSNLPPPLAQKQHLDFGSAPAGTASLMQYAAAFHRTSSSTQLSHLSQVIVTPKHIEPSIHVSRPNLVRGRSSTGSRTYTTSSTGAVPPVSRNVRFRDRSASASANFDADRGKPVFSPVNVMTLGTSLAPSVLRSTPTDGSSTPTQSLVQRGMSTSSEQYSSGAPSLPALLGAFAMSRTLSKDSSRSARSEVASPIFEVDEDVLANASAEQSSVSTPDTERPRSTYREISSKASSPLKRDSSEGFNRPGFAPYAGPTMAITIGDEIRASPLPPTLPICRSLSPACFGGKSLPIAPVGLTAYKAIPRPRRATQASAAICLERAVASAVPAKLSSSVGPHREWSWEKMAGECPVKTYDLPQAALGQNGKAFKPLFYFH